MKRNIIQLAAASIVLPVLIMTPALAHEGHVHNEAANNETVTVTTETNVESELSETSPEQKRERIKSNVNQAELEARIAAKKEALAQRLSAAEAAKLKNRCAAAQGKIASLHGRIQGIETSRGQVHSNAVERLEKLATALDNAGIETNDLETKVAGLQQQIAAFDTALGNYKLAVADVVALDCEADPTAFKAALEAARTAQKEVRDASRAVHTHIKETIKPAIVSIRSSLDTQESEEARNESNE